MKKLFILVGLPASGKSTYCSLLRSENLIILSSDEIRLELFGDETCQANNKLVFDTLNKRVKDALKNNKDVVYDATSLTKVVRKNIITKFQKDASEIICIFFNVSLDECIKRNSKRERTVPVDVLRKMANRLEVPDENEGFNRIIVQR